MIRAVLAAIVVSTMALACGESAGPSTRTAGPLEITPPVTAASSAAPPASLLGSPNPSPVATATTAPTEAPATSVPPTGVPVAVVPVLPTTVTPSPTASQPPIQTGGQATVTLSDDGSTLRLHVGDRFLVSLGDQYNWDVSIDDQSVVSRVIGIAVVRGAQGVYEARTTGQTKLQAVGDLPCRQSRPPCLAPSRLFRLTISVS